MLRFYLQVYLFLMVVMLFSLVSKKTSSFYSYKAIRVYFQYIHILQRLENLISFYKKYLSQLIAAIQ